METDLVQSVADDRWRLKRAAAIEANIYTIGLTEPDKLHTGHEQSDAALAMARTFLEHGGDLALLSLYEGRLQRKVERNIARDPAGIRRVPSIRPSSRICLFVHPIRRARAPSAPPQYVPTTHPESRLMCGATCAGHSTLKPSTAMRGRSPRVSASSTSVRIVRRSPGISAM